MKNKLSDLNNHLFAEIERLGDEDLEGELLIEEIHRAKSVCDVAEKIISNARLILDAAKAADEISGMSRIPLLLE